MADRNESKIDTIIGAASEVHGNVIVKGSILVAGKVKGDVISDDFVRVAESAVISGNLEAKSSVIGGQVEGNVLCQTKVQLGRQSTLLGDLKAARLVIEEGAVFSGNCEVQNPNETTTVPGVVEEEGELETIEEQEVERTQY
jgi:cytoskeletal protein CcmA (bactofilin family)